MCILCILYVMHVSNYFNSVKILNLKLVSLSWHILPIDYNHNNKNNNDNNQRRIINNNYD